jgi:hypothetical protein
MMTTNNLTIRSGFSWKIWDASVDSMELSHEFFSTKLTTNIKMVMEVEVLPPVDVLKLKKLCDLIQRFVEFLIRSPSCLVLLYSFDVEGIARKRT